MRINIYKRVRSRTLICCAIVGVSISACQNQPHYSENDFYDSYENERQTHPTLSAAPNNTPYFYNGHYVYPTAEQSEVLRHKSADTDDNLLLNYWP